LSRKRRRSYFASDAERVFGTLHIIGALLLLWASTITSVDQYPLFYLIMLFNSMAFMPTIALNNTVSYIVLEKNQYDIVKDFPPIRVWGTIGFIAAMWLVDFLGFTKSPMQLYVSAGSGLLLGIYAFLS
jgi:NHS family xanthosine MFS transporter